MAKKATTKTQVKAGRPTGAKTQNVVVDATKSRCPKCSSTNRTPYSHTRAVASGGRDGDGVEHTHVVFRNTRCAKCGQARVDRTVENRTSSDVSSS